MPEASSPPNSLPEGVDSAALYEGPKVVPMPSGKAAFVAPQPTLAEVLTQPMLKTRELKPGDPDYIAQWPPPALPVATASVKRDYPAVVELALDVLSARLLGLIALVTACVVWGSVVYAPDPWRIIAAAGFSVLVFSPIMVIYWRAGMKGEGG